MLNRALVVVGIGVIVSYMGLVGAQADPGTPAIVYVFLVLLAAFVVLVAATVVGGPRR